MTELYFRFLTCVVPGITVTCSLLSLLLTGQIPAPAAGTAHAGKSLMKAGKSGVTTETATSGGKNLRETQDAAELTPDLPREVAPGPDPDPGPGPDQETASGAGRHPDPGPDPVQEKEIKHGRTWCQPPPEAGRNPCRKTGGDTVRGLAPGREEKKNGHPITSRNLRLLGLKTPKKQ